MPFWTVLRKSAPGFALIVLLLVASATSASAQRQLVRVTGIPPLILGAQAGADFDGDGDEDVFITGKAPDGTLHSALYRFDQRRVVQLDPLAKPDVYADYTVVPFLKTSVWKGSVNWHDLNNSSRPDILVTRFGGISLFENINGSQFRDVTKESQLEIDGWCTAAAWADINRDGWLDLYVCRYLEW